MPKRIFIIAGEASGDLHGSNLVKSIKELAKEVEFTGIGGERMKQAGVRLIAHCSDMAVVGFTEVLKKAAYIIKIRAKVKDIFEKQTPDLLILIDYPEFNLHIAKYAKNIGIPVMYYISPQVWAWRTGRVKKIKKRVDKMVVILPFEEKFYKKWDIDAVYVGHPIMDEIPKHIDIDKTKRELKLESAFPIITLLPGSRMHEITNTLPVMVKAAYMLKNEFKGIRANLVLANSIDKKEIEKYIQHFDFIKIFPNRNIYECLAISDLAFVTSGTATLETAIIGTPMIVVYKGSTLSFWIAKALVNVKYVSLVNLIAEEKVVPEILQEELTPQNLTKEALKILNLEELRLKMKQKLYLVKEKLGKEGASKRAAEVALRMIGE